MRRHALRIHVRRSDAVVNKDATSDLRRMAVQAVIIYDVEYATKPAWSPGPLPVAIPADIRKAGWSTSASADYSARVGYFNSNVASTLYGSLADPVRWYRELDAVVADAHVVGVEVATDLHERGHGYAVVHIAFASDAVAQLQGLTRLDPPRGLSAHVEAFLPPTWRLRADNRRATSIAIADGVDLLDERASEDVLWHLASATPSEALRPSAQELSSGNRIDLSRDWSALVLRDGVAFLIDVSAGGFRRFAQVLARTVYLDVILLARMQLRAIERLTKKLTDRGLDDKSATVLINLERETFDFRRLTWWTNISTHRNADLLLQAYQAGHQLEARVAGLVADVSDASRLATTLLSQRSSLALTALSFVGVPLTAAYAGAVLLPYSGWPLFAVASVAGLVFAALLFFVPLEVRRRRHISGRPRSAADKR